MPKGDLIARKVSTKLMFIPDSNTDEYEMMLTVQKDSELVKTHYKNLFLL